MDPWRIIHILGFIIPNFLTNCLVIMLPLAIFQAWICVGVGIGKFLIDLGFGNFFNTKITCSGSMLTSGWLSVSLHYNNRLNAVMDR